MADNVNVTPGTGATIATDDVSGVQYQKVKLDKGADGVSSPVTDANPLPIQITDGTDVAAVSASGALQVGGTLDGITSLPLPSGAATETTLDAINDKTLTPQTGITSAADQYLPVAQVPAQTFRAGFDRVFSNAVDTDQFTLLQTGSGQTVNQTSGSLLITTGTTANAETIIRSVETVKGAFVMRFSTTLTQRIANQNFYVELVDVVGDSLSYTLNSSTSMTITIPSNPFTSANVGQAFWVSANALITAASQRVTIASVSGNDVTVTGTGWPASGSGTCDVFGRNYHQCLFTGTTATNMQFDAQRNGWASGATTATINTTASTTVPTYASADSEVVVFDQTGASATGLEATQRGSRVRNVPDSDVVLYLQIRCLNGTTNPASTTTWTVGFVDIQHCSTSPVTLQNISPMSANTALPMNIVGSSATLSTSVTGISAGSTAIGDVGIQYRASSTGAASGAHLVSAATTNATVIKASAGRLIGWSLANTNAAWRYVKFHNQTTSPTAGTGVVRTVGIPPAGRSELTLDGGISFTTGIAMTCVTGAADSDTTAVGANDIVGDIFYA